MRLAPLQATAGVDKPFHNLQVLFKFPLVADRSASVLESKVSPFPSCSPSPPLLTPHGPRHCPSSSWSLNCRTARFCRAYAPGVCVCPRACLSRVWVSGRVVCVCVCDIVLVCVSVGQTFFTFRLPEYHISTAQLCTASSFRSNPPNWSTGPPSLPRHHHLLLLLHHLVNGRFKKVKRTHLRFAHIHIYLSIATSEFPRGFP
jgi:hypothetical protein